MSAFIMKRHPELVELSREHQQALQLGLEAKRAAKAKDAEQLNAIMQRYREAFESFYQPHFLEEEQRLLPKLEQVGELELVEQIQHDHTKLRSLANDEKPWDFEQLQAFGELMMDHVRFEERIVFPRFETLFLQ